MSSKDNKKEKGWREIAWGGKITEAGSAKEYKTGDWKTFRPNIDKEECINCDFCWMYCPDMAIDLAEDGSVKGVNLDYCKGCGICADVCPKKCIHMEKEER